MVGVCKFKGSQNEIKRHFIFLFKRIINYKCSNYTNHVQKNINT